MNSPLFFLSARSPTFDERPHTFTPRLSQSSADYASPVTRYSKAERSWRICDRFAAGLLVGVLAAVVVGVI